MKRLDLLFAIADMLWNLYVALVSSLLLLVAIILIRILTLFSEQGSDFLARYFRKIVGEFETK